VLIGVDDVAPGIGEEPADRGDQAGLIGAGKQQARGGGLGLDPGMIACLPAGSLSPAEVGPCHSRL
jgi:hypothetical protein